MKNKATCTKEQVQKAKEALQNLPKIKKKEDIEIEDAIRMIRVTINAAVNKGYTIEQILETLSGSGIDIDAKTLRFYINKAAKAAKGKRIKKQTKDGDVKGNSQTE
jgi:acetolactate synthase small subunit